MSIDVTVEAVIGRSPEDVARFAMNPENDRRWIGGIVEAEALTDPPTHAGTRVRRVAKFLGKRIEYVLEVVDHDPSRRLVMRAVSGPFPLTVHYEFAGADGGTRARIRNQGDASGFYRLAAPLLARLVQRRVARDLKTLKALLEAERDRA